LSVYSRLWSPIRPVAPDRKRDDGKEEAVEERMNSANADPEQKETQETAREGQAPPDVAGDCYSGRDCSGKIINHKDAHNCKNSGGKSWKSPDGTCYNL
jgi:hypothetical protein